MTLYGLKTVTQLFLIVTQFTLITLDDHDLCNNRRVLPLFKANINFESTFMDH